MHQHRPFPFNNFYFMEVDYSLCNIEKNKPLK
ncbi:MAG: hypothetical protein ACJAUO_001525 [Sediminicola sp.]|jgi:hypothetical protein